MATMYLPRIAFAFAALAGSLALAGCADRPTRSHAPTRTTQAAAGTAPEATSAARAARRPLPDATGIPACDDYLSSYKACHRAAGIYAPSQLENRYQAMRTSLLRDSQDPDIRPQLAARCNSLANQLRQALHGKACDVEPAPASSSPR